MPKKMSKKALKILKSYGGVSKTGTVTFPEKGSKAYEAKMSIVANRAVDHATAGLKGFKSGEDATKHREGSQTEKRRKLVSAAKKRYRKKR